MKFDVIVGNPPYVESGQSSNSIWNKFIEKSLLMLRQGGIISMIVPRSISFSSRFQKIRTSLSHIGLKSICHVSEKVFDVDIQITYFVAGEKFVGKTKIIDEDKSSFETSLREKDPWFKNEKLFRIIRKIEEVSGAAYFETSSYNFKNEKRVDDGFSVVSLINGKFFKIENEGKVSDRITKPRIIMSYLFNDKYPLKAVWFIPAGISAGKYRSMDVSNNKTGENLQSLFKTKLFSFIHSETASSRSLDNSQLRFLPLVISRTWTDHEIYNHFNLTPEEIEYIENTVK
jgi:hypothetical protein